MTLKSYLWVMRISTLISLTGWAAVLYYIDPEESGLAGEALFYLSTFLFVSGMFILFFTWLQKKSLKEIKEISGHLGQNFRRGVLVGLLAVILLFLQEMKYFTWWFGLLVFAGICLFEFYFITHKEE